MNRSVSPCQVTFVRTCTTIIKIAGRIVVTDPWFSMRMRFLPALVRPGMLLDQVPVPDLVLCSHLHADHFEPAAIARMAGPETVVVGPPGTAAALAATGLAVNLSTPSASDSPSTIAPATIDHRPSTIWQVLEPGLGQTARVAGLELTPYRVPHTFPPPEENGYVIEGGGLSLFFGGDGAYGPIYRDVGRRHRVDVALLPVGGSLIFGRRTVMSPSDAVQAAVELGAGTLIPLHPGGEWLPLPPLSWHPGRTHHAAIEARRRGLDLRVHVLARGGTAVLPATGGGGGGGGGERT